MNFKFSILILIIIIYSASSYSSVQWSQTNGPYGGTITCFAANDSVVLAGGRSGIYKSTDNGLNWTVCTNGLHNSTANLIEDLIFSDSCFYAATFDGIFKSCDNGFSWQQVRGGFIFSLFEFGGRLFFAGDTIAGYTTDKGLTWNFLTGINSISAFGSNMTKLFAVTSMRVYSSVDSGSTWVLSDSGLNCSGITKVISMGNILFASTLNCGVYKSTDDGHSWVSSSIGLTIPNIPTMSAEAGILYAGTFGDGVFVSSDTGQTWISISNGLFNKTIFNRHSLYTYDSTVWAGTDGGGIYFSNNAGAIWSIRNENIIGTSVSAFFETPFGLFVGTKGSGVFKTTDQGNSWVPMNYGITNYFITSLIMVNNKIFISTDGGGVFQSSDSGNTWTRKNNGLNDLKISSMVYNGTNLIITTNNYIYKSSDYGNSWMSPGNSPNMYDVKVINNGPIVYAYNYLHVYVSFDDGFSWNYSRAVTDIFSLIPFHSDMLMIIENGGVDITRDSGATWHSYATQNAGMHLIPTDSLFYDSGLGIRYSYDQGLSWIDIGMGLPWQAAYYSSPIYLSQDIIYVSVDWAGVWKGNVSSLIGVDEINSENFTVYPNPSNDYFRILFEKKKIQTFEVYNSLGELILNGENDNSSELQINLSNYPPGIYFAILKSSKENYFVKLIRN